ncbi:MAG: MarR family winged helix-turn-helix transcriptional regulator [Solirubrobacteraceae bacterium]
MPPDADPAEDDELAALQEALGRLFRGVRKARGHGNQHLRSPMSLPQYHLLEPLITHDEPMPVGRLAELAMTTPPTATTMVRSLEGRGLVERRPDPNDRRVVRVALTPAGREATSDWRHRIDAWRLRLTSAIDPADRAAALRVLDALAEQVEQAVGELTAGGGVPPEMPAPADGSPAAD